MMMCVGFLASISSRVIWSLRTTWRSMPRVDLAQALDQVVGERVVVVDQDDHGRAHTRGARRTARADLHSEMDRNACARRPEENLA